MPLRCCHLVRRSGAFSAAQQTAGPTKQPKGYDAHAVAQQVGTWRGWIEQNYGGSACAAQSLLGGGGNAVECYWSSLRPDGTPMRFTGLWDAYAAAQKNGQADYTTATKAGYLRSDPQSAPRGLPCSPRLAPPHLARQPLARQPLAPQHLAPQHLAPQQVAPQPLAPPHLAPPFP